MKFCNKCNVQLRVGDNWWKSAARVHNNTCIPCKRAYFRSRAPETRENKARKSKEVTFKAMLQSAAQRARKNGVPYELYEVQKDAGKNESLEVACKRLIALAGDRCSYTGREWEYTINNGSTTPGDFVPSLDRMDPAKGYVWGNVQVVSNAINRFKGSMTTEQFQDVLDSMCAYRE